MALQLPSPHSSTLATPEDRKPEVVRRSAGFHPSVWGDYFLKYSEDTKKVDAWANRVEELKEEVKRMMSEAKGSVQELQLIDTLQRLGVAYHFEKEIDEALQWIYGVYATVDLDDLHAVALRFRLLRQEGYNVSSDVFTKFKDDHGHFKDSLISDVRGMLSLYEAAYLSTHGEDILDEAIVFTTGHLKSLMAHLDHPLATQVSHALELPLRKRILRLEARYYILVYGDDVARSDVLLELAKLDFNVVQSLHRREIKDISKWWKDIDIAGKLPYVRDRVVEGYFWIISVYFEPQYSRARIIMAKMIGLISIIDDTYDAYGTLEELELFTDAIQRGDFIFGFSIGYGPGSNVNAEVRAIHDGLKFCANLGLQIVIVESDSRLVVDFLNGVLNPSWKWSYWVCRINRFRTILHAVFSHIYLEGNDPADGMACLGSSLQEPYFTRDFSLLPRRVRGSLFLDKVGLGSVRMAPARISIG